MAEIKRILFISPRFFNYEKAIISELQDRGYVVDWIEDRPFISQFMRVVTTKAPYLVQRYVDILYKKEINKFECNDYDMVFVINGQTLSVKFMRHIKKLYPSAVYILYMWDSLANRGNGLSLMPFFDKVSTFDKEDAIVHSLNFRPLFCSNPQQKQRSKRKFKYDLSFVGTLHSDRYKVIKRLSSSLPDSVSFYKFMYLQAPWVFLINRLLNPDFRGAKKSDFYYTVLPKGEYLQNFDDSLAFLDIQHPDQKGLTIRCLEVTLAKRKLVTTDQSIRTYDFYRASNIAIIDRENPNIPSNFFKESWEELPSDLVYKYSIHGWLDDLMTL